MAVQYESQAQAEAMREILDGVTWPANGRRLSADFATEEEAHAAAAGKPVARRQERAVARPALSRPEPVKKEAVARKPVKKLDDLFKKTTTKPALYWIEATKPAVPV